jgi:hypothetical protein
MPQPRTRHLYMVMAEDLTHLALPSEIEGDVTLHALAGGRASLEGWVASLNGHLRALEIGRQASGCSVVEDRLEIVLSRSRYDQ